MTAQLLKSQSGVSMLPNGSAGHREMTLPKHSDLSVSTSLLSLPSQVQSPGCVNEYIVVGGKEAEGDV